MNAVTEVRSAAALRAARPVHRASVHSTARQGTHSPSCDAAASGSTTMTLTLRGVVRGTTVRELPGGTGGAGGGGRQTSGSGEPAVLPVAAPATAPAFGTEEHRLSNEEEFSAYVRERRASLYATAYHLTGDRYAAEDLLQSALFSTYRAWDRITDKAAVGGYMRRTMTNLHISAWRRRKVNEYPTEEMPETVGDTDAMGGTELRAVLWQALAKLPENQRTMLVLRYYEGRTDPEIADVLNISVGTVKSSIWRALRRLREDEILASRDGDLGGAFGELVA
ncbi:MULTISPECIES: SigE family RNA polymerase sigma factor [unclassified Streptacidiphilus]|uniref:SigE family RNA polymerase sigma factor n=2 Tax=Streptacidiphilus TaxID=228398 RepID=A0ABV6USA3_9ACTN